MQTFKDFIRQAWCRIVHGSRHGEVGDVGKGKILYMCARCLKCDALHTIN